MPDWMERALGGGGGASTSTQALTKGSIDAFISSRPQVRGSPLCSGSTAAVTTVVAHGARWQCALTGFLPPLVTA